MRNSCWSRAGAISLLLWSAHGALGQATTNPEATRSAPAAPRQQAVAREGWWNDAVFYEVFVRSFADSTDGPLAGDGVGDLRGLIERLDYLNDGKPETGSDLGVTALWLMPITQSPSYHGYDTTDYFTVNKDYGTNDDFKRLVADCHKRGIRVIIDLVLNHTSHRHPWFEAAQDPADPHRAWFRWSDTLPSYRGPWNQTVWHPQKPRASAGPYFYGCFGRDMPDLDYTNPAVTAQMREVIRFWLEDMGCDGFRLDAIRHLIEDGKQQDNTPQTHAWLREFATYYRSVNKDAFAVGEVWSTTDAISSYVGDQMDSAFEFPLAQAIVDAVNSGKADKLVATLRQVRAAYPPNAYSTFLTNHDQPRVMTQLKGDKDKARLAASLLLTLPGTPFMYYGEELGMTGDKPDPEIRTPMPWKPGPTGGFTIGKPWKPLNQHDPRCTVASEETDPTSLLNHYRRMIRLRQEEPALRRGDFELVETHAAGVLAFRRASGESRVLVVANLSDKPVADWTIGSKRRLGREFVRGLRELTERRAGTGGPDALPARTVLVFDLPAGAEAP